LPSTARGCDTANPKAVEGNGPYHLLIPERRIADQPCDHGCYITALTISVALNTQLSTLNCIDTANRKAVGGNGPTPNVSACAYFSTACSRSRSWATPKGFAITPAG